MDSFASTFAEQGYLRFDKLFDPALIAAAHGEYESQFGGRAIDELPPHLEVGDKRVQLPIEVTGPIADPMLTSHPLLLRMLEALLGKDVLIDSFSCVVAWTGAADQLLHRDHHELFPGAAESGEGLPPYAVTVAVPLVDLTPETGATRLYAGSHQLAAQPAGKPPPLGEGEVAYVARGGCYLMDYRLWHHGTANRSAAPRPVLYIIYARPWFTDAHNFAEQPRICLPSEAAAAMPPAQRRLFRRVEAGAK